jgi:hypothetical protein
MPFRKPRPGSPGKGGSEHDSSRTPKTPCSATTTSPEMGPGTRSPRRSSSTSWALRASPTSTRSARVVSRTRRRRSRATRTSPRALSWPERPSQPRWVLGWHGAGCGGSLPHVRRHRGASSWSGGQRAARRDRRLAPSTVMTHSTWRGGTTGSSWTGSRRPGGLLAAAGAGLRFVARSAGGLSSPAPVVSRPNGAPHGRVQACRNRLI